MIEIEDNEAIELYNKLKQIILNNKDHEYSEQDGNEDGKTTFINKYGDEITIEIYHRNRYDTYGASIKKKYCDPFTNEYDGFYTKWELERTNRPVLCGWGWDYDDYYVVTSRELPENILKPFIKKKHRPKKPKQKVYIENPIIDNRSIIDELAEAYKRYYSATQKKEEISKEKESKIKEAIEKVTAQYKEEINNRNLEVKNTQKELKEYDALVVKYSTFDVDLIGKVIARIISSLSDKEFIYEQVIDEYKVNRHDLMGAGFVDKIKDWDIVIIDSSKHQKRYYEDDVSKHSQVVELVKSGDAICLAKSWSTDEPITFLTSNNGVISFNVELDSFSYIKDFIIELVQYRFQRGLDKFTEDDMNLCVDRFIKKSEKIKIQNRVLVLKKELDTLNSKLSS